MTKDKPKKKDISIEKISKSGLTPEENDRYLYGLICYNQAIDDYEKWLNTRPYQELDEGEVKQIIKQFGKKSHRLSDNQLSYDFNHKDIKKLSQAIAKKFGRPNLTELDEGAFKRDVKGLLEKYDLTHTYQRPLVSKEKSFENFSSDLYAIVKKFGRPPEVTNEKTN